MSENQPTLGQPPAAPRKGMSTGVIVLIVLGVCGFCLIPILAAIAIPAFLSFTRRAKATEARSNISAITRMLQHYAMIQPAGANGSSLVRLSASIPRIPAEPPCVSHVWTAIELAT
jgi:Tfp pilus assembly protein PilE